MVNILAHSIIECIWSQHVQRRKQGDPLLAGDLVIWLHRPWFPTVCCGEQLWIPSGIVNPCYILHEMDDPTLCRLYLMWVEYFSATFLSFIGHLTQNPPHRDGSPWSEHTPHPWTRKNVPLDTNSTSGISQMVSKESANLWQGRLHVWTPPPLSFPHWVGGVHLGSLS